MSQSSLRIIGYATHAELPERVKMAAEAGWDEWEGDDDQVRLAFSSAKLHGREPQEIASLVVALLGAEKIAGRHVFLQSKPRFYEMSVTLIDEAQKPDFYQPSELVSVSHAVVDFLARMR